MNEPRSRTPEEQIENALQMLRIAEPRPGMEQRILAGLRVADDAVPVAARGSWLRWPAMSLVAAVVAIAFVLAWHGRLARPHAAPEHSQAVAGRPFMQRPAEALNVEQPSQAILHVSTPQATRVTLLRSNQGAEAVAKVNRPDAAALEGIAEQSFPAPPLPLTDQERLLLRIVHRGDPVQLAQLTPAAREAQLQRERDDVSAFFAPPPPLDQQVQ